MIPRANLKTRALAFIIYFVYRILSVTWRIEIHETEALKAAKRSGKPLIYAHWHGDELALLSILRRYRGAVMTSTSQDGQLVTEVLGWAGIKTSRGSSTRGGATALKGLLRLTAQGYNPTVAIDGPRGPYHKAKPGIFEISKVIGADIFAGTCACSRALVFHKAWNKTFLPYPFARIVLVFAEKIPQVAADRNPRDPELAQRLEMALADAGQQARNLVAAPRG